MLLAGCAPAPQKPGGAPPAGLERAQALLEKGEYAQVAQLYEQAAREAEPSQRAGLALEAADAYLKARDLAAADRLLGGISRARLEGPDGVRYDLVAAELALAQSAPGQALSRLPREAAAVPEEWRARYHRLRAQALLDEDQPYAAAQERLALQQWLQSPEEARANREALLSALLRMAPDSMQANLQALPADSPMSGWLALAYQVKTQLFEGKPMGPALARWREQYPGHPGGEALARDLIQRYQQAFRYPPSVALLLPLSGRFEAAAESIRNGFLTAYYEGQEGRPSVRIYDVASHPQGVVGAYRQAVNDGAGWVVGPLDKDAVSTLLSQPDRPVPILALNYLDEDTPPAAETDRELLSLRPGDAAMPPEPAAAAGEVPGAPRSRALADAFQFGLLPEQEARQAAEKLISDGHHRALVLAPTDDWGQRLARAFARRFTELGGFVADVGRFDPNRSDHSDTIRALLDLQAGIRRDRALEQLLGRDLNYVPHMRNDVDALFLAARPGQARLIKPQLRFFQAVDLPVYGTSHIYSGSPAPGNDADLNGVEFCDAPWMLGTSDEPPSRQQAVRWFPNASGELGRLYALGVDAYRLIPYLPWLADHPADDYPGLSGRLTLDGSGHLHRHLAWAVFRHGVPVPLATVTDGDAAGAGGQ